MTPRSNTAITLHLVGNCIVEVPVINHDIGSLIPHFKGCGITLCEIDGLAVIYSRNADLLERRTEAYLEHLTIETRKSMMFSG